MSPVPEADTPARPEPTAIQGQGQGKSEMSLRTEAGPSQPKKRKNHRSKKKRTRRQSFAPSETEDGSGLPGTSRESQSAARNSFYRRQNNHSNTSIESEALLDHRYGLPETSCALY